MYRVKTRLSWNSGLYIDTTEFRETVADNEHRRIGNYYNAIKKRWISLWDSRILHHHDNWENV